MVYRSIRSAKIRPRIIARLIVYLHLILPLHIRSSESDSLATFKSRLKSHLFFSAYHVSSLIRQRLRFDLRLLALYKDLIDTDMTLIDNV